jgi:hypothetical protein
MLNGPRLYVLQSTQHVAAKRLDVVLVSLIVLSAVVVALAALGILWIAEKIA